MSSWVLGSSRTWVFSSFPKLLKSHEGCRRLLFGVALRMNLSASEKAATRSKVIWTRIGLIVQIQSWDMLFTQGVEELVVDRWATQGIRLGPCWKGLAAAKAGSPARLSSEKKVLRYTIVSETYANLWHTPAPNKIIEQKGCYRAKSTFHTLV